MQGRSGTRSEHEEGGARETRREGAKATRKQGQTAGGDSAQSGEEEVDGKEKREQGNRSRRERGGTVRSNAERPVEGGRSKTAREGAVKRQIEMGDDRRAKTQQQKKQGLDQTELGEENGTQTTAGSAGTKRGGGIRERATGSNRQAKGKSDECKIGSRGREVRDKEPSRT